MVQSVCVCQELKMGLSLQHMGERILREPKAHYFSQKGKELLCYLLVSVGVCY